jgi:hypothetical protein
MDRLLENYHQYKDRPFYLFNKEAIVVPAALGYLGLKAQKNWDPHPTGEMVRDPNVPGAYNYRGSAGVTNIPFSNPEKRTLGERVGGILNQGIRGMTGNSLQGFTDRQRSGTVEDLGQQANKILSTVNKMLGEHRSAFAGEWWDQTRKTLTDPEVVKNVAGGVADTVASRIGGAFSSAGDKYTEGYDKVIDRLLGVLPDNISKHLGGLKKHPYMVPILLVLATLAGYKLFGSARNTAPTTNVHVSSPLNRFY